VVERYLHGMSYHDILRHITEGLPADAVRFVQLVALAQERNAPQEMRDGLHALHLVREPQAQRDPLRALLHLMERRFAFNDEAGLAMRFLLRCFHRSQERRELLLAHLHHGLTQPELIPAPAAYYLLLVEYWLCWLPMDHDQPARALEQMEGMRQHLLAFLPAGEHAKLTSTYRMVLSTRRSRLMTPQGPRPGHAELGAYVQGL
jgi:hypothetical protein